MNTLYFRYVLEVDRTRSITQAAENLFIAQPNLSKAIRELEESLGFEIFKRTSKGVTPTQKGVSFLERARKITAQLEEIEALKGDDTASIRSLGVALPRSSYIAEGITEFVAGLDFSGITEITVRETSAVKAIRDISEGTISLGVIRYNTQYESYFKDYIREKGLMGELIWEFERLVLMSCGNELASKHGLCTDDLDECVEILQTDEVVPYISVGGDSPHPDFPEKRRICANGRCTELELLSRLKTAYMWSAPVPEQVLGRYGLVQRVCAAEDNRFRDILVGASGRKWSELEKKLIDRIFRAKNDVAFSEYS